MRDTYPAPAYLGDFSLERVGWYKLAAREMSAARNNRGAYHIKYRRGREEGLYEVRAIFIEERDAHNTPRSRRNVLTSVVQSAVDMANLRSTKVLDEIPQEVRRRQGSKWIPFSRWEQTPSKVARRAAARRVK